MEIFRRVSGENPSTKSEELKIQLSTTQKGSLTSLEIGARKYSDAPARAYSVSHKKSVAF